MTRKKLKKLYHDTTKTFLLTCRKAELNDYFRRILLYFTPNSRFTDALKIFVDKKSSDFPTKRENSQTYEGF